MKKISKVLSILLAMMLVLGLAVTASAEETGSIHIGNAVEGQTYTAYKIFDVESYAAEGNATTYIITDTSPWYAFVTGEGAGKEYFNLDDSHPTDGTYYVTWAKPKETQEADAAAFAKLALTYAQGNETITAAAKTATAAGTEVTIAPVELGYYVVDSSLGALCSLDTARTQAEIEEKNAVPTADKKVQEDSTSEYGEGNTASNGDVVNFQATVTAQKGAKGYTYHDTMDPVLVFDAESVVVTVNGEALTAGTEYTVVTEPTDECTFEVVFDNDYLAGLTIPEAGQPIIISYSATVTLPEGTSSVNADGYQNNGKLSYGDKGTTTTTPITTTTKTYSLPVFKYAEGEGTAQEPLSGAKFTLSNAAGAVKVKAVAVAEGETPVYMVDPAGTVTEITTDATGRFTIIGLDADDYTLTETEAPKGYNKLEEPITVKIDETGAITRDGAAEPVASIDVLNNAGSLLPATGGIGTTIFYIAGAVLVLGAGVTLIVRKRMSTSK